MKFTLEIEIKSPVEKVFENIRNPANFRQWIPEIKSFEFVGNHNPENPKGTKYKQISVSSRGDQHFDGEITEFVKNEKIGIHLHNFKVTSDGSYKLSTTSNGTRVVQEVDIKLHFFLAGLFARLMSGSIKGRLQTQLEDLKKFSEK